MAVLSDYTSGTITVTQNSVNFTGTDTLWRVARFREGDTVQLQGYTMVINGVDEEGRPIESNTSGQFTEPWPGESGTFQYRMRYMSDGARVSGQAGTLIELLGDGVLENIAAIPIEDGNLLIGNAAGQYEPISKDDVGIQDPKGSLGKLAALTLEASKILNTDASGNLTQSDITAVSYAPQTLNSSQQAQARANVDAQTYGGILEALRTAVGAASNTFPYFTGTSSAGFTPLTALARTLLASTTGAAIWAAIGGTSSLGANGWIKFPDGLIIQWGRNDLESVGAFNPQVLGGVTYYTHFYYITLPIPFPNAFYSVTGSNLGWTPQNQGSMAGKTLNLGREGSDLNRFALSFSAPQTGDVPIVGWIAVGR